MALKDGNFKAKVVVRWRGVPTPIVVPLEILDGMAMLVLQHEPDGITHKNAVEVFARELHPIDPPNDGASFLLLKEVGITDQMKTEMFGEGPFPPASA